MMRAEGREYVHHNDRLRRSRLTSLREFRRNAATRNGKLECRTSTAQWNSWPRCKAAEAG
ncbi:hypothetical protein B8W66_08070 [Mycobacterium decipiens]|uniref:Uncharacterized protein n=1 Tax=Mycobacterium decipiens TaxID=1430326 RepID=A0A1X2LYC8_9MYCO|nr:hypothetical protein B8W66_08070 [Mycobacterium decipiens]